MRANVLCFATAALAWPLLAAADHHEGSSAPQPKAWDQARVAALAGELSSDADDLREAVRRQQAAQTIATGQNLASEQVMDQLRGLRAECNRLKRKVEAGKSRDDTLLIFKRIDEIRRDTAEELRRMFLTRKNLDQIEAGRAKLEELRLFYTGQVDTRPDLAGPKDSENTGGSKK